MMIQRAVLIASVLLLAACGPMPLPVATETLAETDLILSVRGEGELRSTKPTLLNVPGSNWSSRRVEWMLPEGSVVAEGDLLARFASPSGELQLAQAMIELQRNALSRAAKKSELEAAIGRVEVDLSEVAVQLGIARRYSGADLSTLARAQILDALEDARYLETRQNVLAWQRDQSGVRGGAELAVLEAQRATYDLNAQQRQGDLDALELRAPNAGILQLTSNWSGDKPMVGTTLYAGTEFGSLPDTSSMEVEIDLPQMEAQALQTGMTVSLHPLGRPKQTIATELSWVAGAATVKGRYDPVRYLSIRAPVSADAITRLGLVPGQRMAARIELLRARCLSVANVAVRQRDGRNYVQVRRGPGFEDRELELGTRGTARAQVLSGLSAGDEVMLSPGGDPPALVRDTPEAGR